MSGLGRIIEELPVEDAAATVASAVRRLHRRVRRRPAGTALFACACFAVAGIASNALWRQEEAHPAPFWGASEQDDQRAAAPLAQLAATVARPAERDGAASDLVRRIQERLFADSDADGVLDRETEERIRAFERKMGWPQTGRPTVGLLTALESERDVSERPAATSLGSTLDVAAVQALLNERGYGPLAVDGVMGPRTREAIRRFAATPEGQRVLPSDAKRLAAERG